MSAEAEMPRSIFEKVKDGKLFQIGDGPIAKVIFDGKVLAVYRPSIDPGHPETENSGVVGIFDLEVLGDEEFDRRMEKRLETT